MWSDENDVPCIYQYSLVHWQNDIGKHVQCLCPVTTTVAETTTSLTCLGKIAEGEAKPSTNWEHLKVKIKELFIA